MTMAPIETSDPAARGQSDDASSVSLEIRGEPVQSSATPEVQPAALPGQHAAEQQSELRSEAQLERSTGVNEEASVPDAALCAAAKEAATTTVGQKSDAAVALSPAEEASKDAGDGGGGGSVLTDSRTDPEGAKSSPAMAAQAAASQGPRIIVKAPPRSESLPALARPPLPVEQMHTHSTPTPPTSPQSPRSPLPYALQSKELTAAGFLIKEPGLDASLEGIRLQLASLQESVSLINAHLRRSTREGPSAAEGSPAAGAAEGLAMEATETDATEGDVHLGCERRDRRLDSLAEHARVTRAALVHTGLVPAVAADLNLRRSRSASRSSSGCSLKAVQNARHVHEMMPLIGEPVMHRGRSGSPMGRERSSVHAALRVRRPSNASNFSAGPCTRPTASHGLLRDFDRKNSFQSSVSTDSAQGKKCGPTTATPTLLTARRPSAASIYSGALGCVLPNLVEAEDAGNNPESGTPSESPTSNPEAEQGDSTKRVSLTSTGWSLGNELGDNSDALVHHHTCYDNDYLMSDSPAEQLRSVASKRSLVHSDSVGLLEDTENQSRWLLMPASGARLVWTAIALAATFAVVIVVPMRVVYLSHVQPTLASTVAYAVVDAVLLLDILVNFRTVICKDGILIANARCIAVHYAKSWLLADLLAAYPLSLLPEEDMWLWLICSLKLLRVSRLWSLISHFQARIQSLQLTPLKLGLCIFIIGHLAACAWRLSLHIDGDYVNAMGLSPETPWLEAYFTDVYWVIATMTTCGYGDIYPMGHMGRLYSCMVMVWGSLVLGFIVETVARGAAYLIDDETESQVRQAVGFMRRRNVTLELQQRVEKNIRQHKKQEKTLSLAPKLLQQLSPAVQRDLSLELLKTVMLKFPLFLGAPRAFMGEVARAHVWVQALPGDIVVEVGQLVQELAFVVQGRLVVLAYIEDEQQAAKERREQARSRGHKAVFTRLENGMTVKEYELEAGAWFGERCLFEEEYVRECTAIAAVEAELAVLPMSQYEKIITKFPRLMQRHKFLAAGVESGELDVSDLEYRPPDSTKTSQRRSWFTRAYIREEEEDVEFTNVVG
eukprot:TRINITY_DN49095_c0_g2_i1.p1 TRINITY_DN49095_c0_g2~~TRINITY_DN49095_c0_g2_i1.p1  ORF type:complete len:1063 (+),score=209.41 TRINITY_DN49095_c0_g2_i1:57-3245(+)